MSRLAALAGRRWPALALVASLVLNGFLIGMIATSSFRPHHRPPGPRVFSFELRHVADRLPREATRAVAAELEPLAPPFEARLEKIRAARDEIGRMAAAPQPDRAAIDSRLEALRAQTQAMQADVQRVTFDAVLKLPPETRAALAESRRRRR